MPSCMAQIGVLKQIKKLMYIMNISLRWNVRLNLDFTSINCSFYVFLRKLVQHKHCCKSLRRTKKALGGGEEGEMFGDLEKGWIFFFKKAFKTQAKSFIAYYCSIYFGYFIILWAMLYV